MSKNYDRNKVDLTHLDLESLEELETESFERFHPKKRDAKKQPPSKKKNRNDTEVSYQ